MLRFLSAVKKDFLILIRDKAGLAIIFVMPMALVLIMTLLQDSAYRTLNESGIPIVYIDEDQDTLGIGLEKGLERSGFFEISKTINGKPATRKTAWEAVASGKYMIGIIIPKGTSKAIRSGVADLVSQTLKESGLTDADSLQKEINKKVSEKLEIEIILDPGTRKSHVVTVTTSLREFISKLKSQIIFQTFTHELSGIIPVNTNIKLEDTDPVVYKEVYALKDERGILPNAVQHNVPAWSVFSMFFIIIPLAGSIIMERGEGSAFRLKTIPNAIQVVLASKLLVYMLVCLSQLVLMLMVGIFILPLLGLPRLQFGDSPMATILVGIFTAMAATCYGMMFGTVTTTNQQAAIGGSVSVLIMAALGGVWVPVHLMPGVMKTISKLSPLNWGLEAFHDIFLRGGGIKDVLPELGLLLGFSLACVAISFWYTRKKNNL
ncbi:MAG TPA: ABC transporter permease [Cytophagaceae bacterium]|jgi:ABC-2 type transport system permease protein|nr:ABC transporter permease [Cytophagaceae bacterium]